MRICAVYFSPCGNTAKVVKEAAEAFAEASGNSAVENFSITTPEGRRKPLNFTDDDFVVIGVPTYAGRVPNKIMPFIRDEIKGNNTPAAAVVTYGNRSFDDSLIELATLMKDNGYIVTGGGAFVSEHSFAEKLATGKPDKTDCSRAAELGRSLYSKMLKKDYSEPELPGNKNFNKYYVPKGRDGKPAVFLKAKPFTDHELCTKCGNCAEVCPMGSISPEEDYEVTGICIKCQACIKNCEPGAKYFTDEAFLSHRGMLEENFADVENHSEIYIF